ncbi:MAG: hypothetical protein O7E52_22380 [Candidatus Poribacteria bacterium]|nr:hypothetical protein [Candidatus Poribacteria bacterium]
MHNRFRRESRAGLSNPIQNVTKSMSTSQGQYTFYAIIICAIIGMASYKPLIFLVQRFNPAMPPQGAADLANLISYGICVVLLIASLLKMQTIMAVIEKRRLEAFNQRMERRKESNSSDE